METTTDIEFSCTYTIISQAYVHTHIASSQANKRGTAYAYKFNEPIV